MLWRPPIWSGPVSTAWRKHALLAGTAAATEAGIGFWLRQIPSLSGSTSAHVFSWIAGLAGWLGLRVLLSWRRDVARETSALAAGTNFHRRIWESIAGCSVSSDTAWFARDGREWIENGTRAAAEMRTALVTMVVLVPMLIWLAPWLALAVLGCGLVLGWVAQWRSKAGRSIAERDGSQAREEAEMEEWAWRAMPEAAASGLGHKVSCLSLARHRGFTERRWVRIQSLLAWGALGEAAAHAGGWVLAAVSLGAWKLGWLESGNLAGFLGLALLAYRPVREAGRLLPQMQKAEQVWNKWTAPSPKQGTSTKTTTTFEVADLRAGWDPSATVLHAVGFRADPGDILVAFGANGCGKSTLLAALAGICPCFAGTMSLPGPRRWMAQEPILPPLAPADWMPRVSTEAMEVLFPSGLPSTIEWNAPVPRGGHILSRGQRARLALLAVASAPDGLWLLDEAFSALPLDDRPILMRSLFALRGEAVVLLAEPVIPGGLEIDRLVWEDAHPSGLKIAKVRFA